MNWPRRSHQVLLVTWHRAAQLGDSQGGGGHCTAPEEPAAPWFVCVVLQSKGPETALQVLEQERQHCKCSSREHRKQQEMVRETHFWSCGWHCHLHGLGPVSSSHLLSCTSHAPTGSAKAICLHHTSYDLVSSGNEPCCLGSLAMVCLSISGFVPPVPHPAPKEEVSSAA